MALDQSVLSNGLLSLEMACYQERTVFKLTNQIRVLIKTNQIKKYVYITNYSLS